MKTWEELVDELYGKEIVVTVSSPLCSLQTTMKVESVDSAMQISDDKTEMAWTLGNSKFNEVGENVWSVSGYGITTEIQII